jgi:hypothetical protein
LCALVAGIRALNAQPGEFAIGRNGTCFQRVRRSPTERRRLQNLVVSR